MLLAYGRRHQQVHPNLVQALLIEMVVAAVWADASHDPCLELGPGILVHLPGPGALAPSRATIVSRLLEYASTMVNIVVPLTNLRHHGHHGGHARTPTSRILSEVHTSLKVQMSTDQDE